MPLHQVTLLVGELEDGSSFSALFQLLVVENQSFLTVSNFFNAGMEEDLTCPGGKPVGDSLLGLVQVWHALQVSVGDLGCLVCLESEEEIQFPLSLMFPLLRDTFGGQPDVRFDHFPPL